MSVRRSRVWCNWEDLLSSADVATWTAGGLDKALRERLPTGPGVYRWLFPAKGSEKPSAYVGEGENLRVRVSDYFNATSEPVTSASEGSFSEEELREAIKAIHQAEQRYGAAKAAPLQQQIPRCARDDNSEGTDCFDSDCVQEHHLAIKTAPKT